MIILFLSLSILIGIFGGIENILNNRKQNERSILLYISKIEINPF